MTDFITSELLTNPVGIMLLVEVIVELTKAVLSATDNEPKDTWYYKLLVIFVTGLVLFVFNPVFRSTGEYIALGIVNTILISATLMGVYDFKE